MPIIVEFIMKSTKVSIALLPLLLILPNAYGTRGLVGNPRAFRSQQAVGVLPSPGPIIMRQQRAIPQGHYRQPGPAQQWGKMVAARPRYARRVGSIASPVIVVVSSVTAGTSNAAEAQLARQSGALNDAAQTSSGWTTRTVGTETLAHRMTVTAASDTAQGVLAGAGAGAASLDQGRRRRRNN